MRVINIKYEITHLIEKLRKNKERIIVGTKVSMIYISLGFIAKLLSGSQLFIYIYVGLAISIDFVIFYASKQLEQLIEIEHQKEEKNERN